MCGLGASRCWTWGKKEARSANVVKLLFPAAVNNEQTRLPGLGLQRISEEARTFWWLKLLS